MDHIGSVIYTIGHSNQTLDEFVDLLRVHQIDLVVDVRSAPYSKFVPHFSKKPMQEGLHHAGFRYRYMGDRLGGKPRDPKCRVDGGVQYRLVRQMDWFKQAIAELITLSGQHKTAIVCAEEDPSSCHRELLIGTDLRQKGIEVGHIRRSGLDFGDRLLNDFF